MVVYPKSPEFDVATITPADYNSWPYKGPDDHDYTDVAGYVWFGILDFCGCRSDSLYELTFEMLHKLYVAKLTGGSYYYDFKGKSRTETDLQELILHALHAHDLTEHGSGIRGGWLTDKGIEVCKLIWPNHKPLEGARIEFQERPGMATDIWRLIGSNGREIRHYDNEGDAIMACDELNGGK